jgi:hypothetical protein
MTLRCVREPGLRPYITVPLDFAVETADEPPKNGICRLVVRAVAVGTFIRFVHCVDHLDVSKPYACATWMAQSV